jgi:hypothetical protein
MKNVLLMAIGALLLLSFNAWAQHGNGADQCTFGVVVEDLTCNGATNCESTTFTVPCDNKNYSIECRVSCNPGTPANCKVTAILIRVGDTVEIARCQNWDENGCHGETFGQDNMTLSANVEYRLTVCMDWCVTGCLNCTTCKGWARVSHG